MEKKMIVTVKAENLREISEKAENLATLLKGASSLADELTLE